MIRIYRWDPAARVGDCPAVDQLPPAADAVTGYAVVWVDLEDPSPEEEARVVRQFLAVHPLTLEDITRPRRLPDQGAHLPKAEEFPGYLFVVVNPLPAEVCSGRACLNTRPKKWPRPQLSAILTHNVLITHHYTPLPCVEAVRTRLERRTETTGRGPDFLFHLILDEMVDEYAPVVDQMAERLDRLETRMFRRPSPRVLSALLSLKRQVVFLRKTLTLEREVLARLTRGEFALVSADERAYYRNVYDHLVRYTELVEGAREMVSDLMQTHLSAASNRLNEVMKVLTMISTIGLVCSIIAGVYGMNFDWMPFLKTDHGFWVAMGLMAVAAVGSFVFFRWRKWL
jgi:magnesium transporter